MTETVHLPTIISEFLAAHHDRDAEAATSAFTEDATVLDEGNTYRGPSQIRDWLQAAASEYSYTTELTGTRRVDAHRWIATHHLEGNFPGGVVDLDFDFTLLDGRIQHLAIGP